MREKGQINNGTVKLGKLHRYFFLETFIHIWSCCVYFWDDSLITLIWEVEVVLKLQFTDIVYAVVLYFPHVCTFKIGAGV